MAATTDKIPSLEAGPFVPGNKCTFEIGPGNGFVDMLRSRIELNITPAPTTSLAGSVHAMTTPAGGWGFVQSVVVETMAGQVLERIEDPHILSFALTQHGYGQDHEAYRRVALKENRRDMHDWIVKSTTTGTLSTYRQQRVFLDLNILGIGKYEQFPVAMAGGIRIRLVFGPAAAAFKEYTFGGDFIACADTTGAGKVFTTSQPCYPMTDFGRTMTEAHFRQGDAVAIKYNDGAVKLAVRNVASVVHNSDGTMAITVDGANINNSTAISIARSTAAAITMDPTDPAAFATVPDYTDLTNTPFYMGQQLLVYTQSGGAGAYTEDRRYISGMAINGGNLRLTFNATLTADGNRVGVITGGNATALSYSISDARMRVRRVFPPSNALKTLERGLTLDLVTATHDAFNVPAASRKIDYPIPTPEYFDRALAILAVPVLSAGTTFDGLTRGNRDKLTEFQYEVDRESDPAQAIDVSVARPPIYDACLIRAFDQLSASTDAVLPKVRVLEPARMTFCLPKALNAAGMTRDIATKKVRLTGQNAANADATTIHSYVFHLRSLKLAPNMNPQLV